jgi:hypothetical protein
MKLGAVRSTVVGTVGHSRSSSERTGSSGDVATSMPSRHHERRLRGARPFVGGSGSNIGAVAGKPLHLRTIQFESERPSASAAACHAARSRAVARTPITDVRTAMGQVVQRLRLFRLLRHGRAVDLSSWRRPARAPAVKHLGREHRAPSTGRRAPSSAPGRPERQHCRRDRRRAGDRRVRGRRRRMPRAAGPRKRPPPPRPASRSTAGRAEVAGELQLAPTTTSHLVADSCRRALASWSRSPPLRSPPPTPRHGRALLPRRAV